MEPQYFSLNSPKYEGVNLNPGYLTPLPQHLTAREGQASPADILLAINRMMGLAPARSDYVFGKDANVVNNMRQGSGITPITPIIPSEQAAKEARFIYDQSGAEQASSQEEQIALVQALMQKLGLL
jgi:hypothetical protein